MFNDSKYTKYYFNIIKKAIENPPGGYVERHHIIPRCLGGDDSVANIVPLTARAHFVCHKLLVLMTSGSAKYKMLEAVSYFSNNKNRKLNFNSRDIEKIRKSNAIASSKRNKGNQHYLNRAPASTDLKKLRSSNASKSMWINNGKEEKFSQDHASLVNNRGYNYGRLPFNQTWIKKISQHAHLMSTPAANMKKSIALKGKPKSAEHIKKLKESKEKILPIQCIHCNKLVDPPNYSKWHGENCKEIKPRNVVCCEHCGVNSSYANYRRWHGAKCRSIKSS